MRPYSGLARRTKKGITSQATCLCMSAYVCARVYERGVHTDKNLTSTKRINVFLMCEQHLFDLLDLVVSFTPASGQRRRH